MANDDDSELPADLLAALASPHVEVPGESRALEKVLAWVAGRPPAMIATQDPGPVLALDQFVWTPTSSAQRATESATTPPSA